METVVLQYAASGHSTGGACPQFQIHNAKEIGLAMIAGHDNIAQLEWNSPAETNTSIRKGQLATSPLSLSFSPIVDDAYAFAHVKHSLDSALLLVDAFLHTWRVAAAELKEVIQHGAQAVQVVVLVG